MIAAAAGLEIGLVRRPAFALGFRHGFDWDHLAALSDIAASQRSRRRSMMLATLYTFGRRRGRVCDRAAVILASAHLPASVGEFMERLVGVTLVTLGVWVDRRHAPPRASTRMPAAARLLVAGFRRLRRRPPAPVVIEHEHDHPVGEHHDHELEPVGAARRTASSRGTATDTGTSARSRTTRCRRTAGARLSASGMIHGIGFETPTQALVFVTAAGAGSRAAGLLVLACFLAGLLAANTVVALASTFGLTGAGSRARLYTLVSLVAAAASIALGLLYVFGKGDVMPG